MLKIKRILFPTDFSNCAEQAFDLALSFVKNFDAELFMLHAIVLHQEAITDSDKGFPIADEISEHLSKIARSKLGKIAKQPSERGVSIHQVEERGYAAAEVILNYAETIDADLIVMGTHGRRGPGRLFLGSVAEEVVRGSECPVLTQREKADDSTLGPLRNILVPVDFSEQSIAGLRFATELAVANEARLQLLHVIEIKTLPPFYAASTVAEVSERMERHSSEELDGLADRILGTAAPYECHVALGNTTQVIARVAEEQGSDLIVIPTHGLTGLKRMILGSTAERVVRLAACPVFTLKSFGKSLVLSDA